MSIITNPPDLIISLSRDKVTLELSENQGRGIGHLKTSFEVEEIFHAEHISRSLDRLLSENPILIDQFSTVDIIVVDRPHISVPRHFAQNVELAVVASRHLRVRAGDTLTTDQTIQDAVLCYTIPTVTLEMLREYYVNSTVTHLASIIWQAISVQQILQDKSNVTYYALVHNTLIVLASKKGKLIFSKIFTIQNEADLIYYSIACSRMLQSDGHWLVTIENDGSSFEMPGDSLLKIEHNLSLPSLHDLMVQYKLCAS